MEAAHGFPSVYEIGLPALRRAALIAPGDGEAARVQACFALIAALEDTNLLHRGGLSGLHYAQQAARRFLDDGGVGTRDWRERAQYVHRAFVARRLSPGGSADLLAMTLLHRGLRRRPNEARAMTLAILCSGQGLQHPNMFALTGDAPEAAALFAHAAILLGGRDPREMVLSDADDVLHQDRVGQILCTVQALAAMMTLRDVWPRRVIVAGYSVGEVAAWGVAGLVDPTVTLDLVARRAEAMDAASAAGEGLLFIRGLSRNTVDGLCKRHDAAVAIVNPGDAYLLGGGGEALDALAGEAKTMGADRIVRIAVNVASHTPRLAAASAEFRKVLDRTSIKRTTNMGVRLLSGIDGSSVFDIPVGLDKLAAQISHTVQWAACLDGCVEAGASGFLELGPGRALAEMAASTYPTIPARSIEDFRSVNGVRSWLEGFG